MPDAQETTLVILTARPVDVRVASALQAAARALGYPDGCRIVTLSEAGDVQRFVFGCDPWSVMAIDDASIASLRDSFDLDPSQFASDCPASIAGYTLVAVPGFAACLDDADAKRAAWHRMKAATHPENPLATA